MCHWPWMTQIIWLLFCWDIFEKQNPFSFAVSTQIAYITGGQTLHQISEAWRTRKSKSVIDKSRTLRHLVLTITTKHFLVIHHLQLKSLFKMPQILCSDHFLSWSTSLIFRTSKRRLTQGNEVLNSPTIIHSDVTMKTKQFHLKPCKVVVRTYFLLCWFQSHLTMTLIEDWTIYWHV